MLQRSGGGAGGSCWIPWAFGHPSPPAEMVWSEMVEILFGGASKKTPPTRFQVGAFTTSTNQQKLTEKIPFFQRKTPRIFWFQRVAGGSFNFFGGGTHATYNNNTLVMNKKFAITHDTQIFLVIHTNRMSCSQGGFQTTPPPNPDQHSLCTL